MLALFYSDIVSNIYFNPSYKYAKTWLFQKRTLTVIIQDSTKIAMILLLKCKEQTSVVLSLSWGYIFLLFDYIFFLFLYYFGFSQWFKLIYCWRTSKRFLKEKDSYFNLFYPSVPCLYYFGFIGYFGYLGQCSELP